jgi:hypothetical protein
MKRAILVIMFLLLNVGSANAYSEKPVMNLITSAMKFEEGKKELFYSIEGTSRDDVLSFYSGNGYTATFQPKYKEYTFLKDNTVISTIFNSYKMSAPLKTLKKSRAEYILEDKEASRTLNYGYLRVDESISFYNVLYYFKTHGKNLSYKNNVITGSLPDDKLPFGFDRLIFSNGKDNYQFKVFLKNGKIVSYEIFMSSGNDLRSISVTQSKLKRVLRWPAADRIVSRSALESEIKRLSTPAFKIQNLPVDLDLEALRIALNKDKTLDNSFIAKSKNGFAMFNNQPFEMNFEGAVCFKSIAEIKSFIKCSELDIPEFDDTLKPYTDAIQSAIDRGMEPKDLLRVLDAINHSIYLYDRLDLDNEMSNSLSWFYVNVVDRYLSKQRSQTEVI